MECAWSTNLSHPTIIRSLRRFSGGSRNVRVGPHRWFCDDAHELYCMGHMIEAAVAHYGTTGRDTFLKAVRDRHDGLWRNPFNEPECGHNYARSMASWNCLLAWVKMHGGDVNDLIWNK